MTDKIKEQTRQLWRICFPDDSEEFVDFYFKYKYPFSSNYNKKVDDATVSAFQLIPYRMSLGNRIFEIGYVSGCCTHPHYQGKGYMSELLEEAVKNVGDSLMPFISLIPAEPSLFNYYAKFGFATVFGYEKVVYQRGNNSLVSTAKNTLAEGRKNVNDIETFIKKFMREQMGKRNCGMQFTEYDITVIFADLGLSEGVCCAALLTESPDEEPDTEGINALAMMYPQKDGRWIAGDYFISNPVYEEIFFDNICNIVHSDTIEIRKPPYSLGSMTPLGMARITNAHELLKLYAANHPELEECLTVEGDTLIPSNNATYLISNGICLKDEKPSDKSTDSLSLTIGELALWVFAKDVPHMSLMLDL